MSRCPCCNADLAPSEPKVGDVWLTIEDGVLYRITEEYRHHNGGVYGEAVRCWPPQQGCDLRNTLAIWPNHVREGKWVKVTTPLDKAAQVSSPTPKEGT